MVKILSFYTYLINLESNSFFYLKSCTAYDSSVKLLKSFVRNAGDYIRKNSTNAPVLNQLPNLEQFMFEPNRNQLNAVANVLVELQECKCFYCNKVMKKGSYAVDHFIPRSMYPSDTGHNFVLADSSCNSKKSNLLASDEFLHKWQERNEKKDMIIVDRISVLGFLTDKERSHKVAEWAYAQRKENNYLMWNG